MSDSEQIPPLSVREIYAELMLGKKITLEFTDLKERADFVSHIRSVRSKMEAPIKNLGIDESKTVMIIDLTDVFKCKLHIEPKKYPYRILTIEDADTE